MDRLTKYCETEPVFAQNKQVKIEELFNKEVSIHKICLRQGMEGEYAIFLVTDIVLNEQVSFSCGGKAIVEKIKRACDKYPHVTSEGEVLTFEPPLMARFIQRKGEKSGRVYYDIE